MLMYRRYVQGMAGKIENFSCHTLHITTMHEHTSGYFDNRWWPGGSATILVGLLVACMALFARRKKRGQTPDLNDPNWPYATIAPYPTEPGAK